MPPVAVGVAVGLGAASVGATVTVLGVGLSVAASAPNLLWRCSICKSAIDSFHLLEHQRMQTPFCKKYNADEEWTEN